MFKRFLWVAMALAFAASYTWADDKPSDDDLDAANKALHNKDKAKDSTAGMDEASKAARGEQDGAQEPELDPVQALNDIADKMKDAEAALHKAGSWKQAKAQKEAVEKIEKMIKESKDNQGKTAAELQKLIDEAMKKQQEAMESATKMMSGAGSDQQKALEEIEKLIKQAKETG